MKRDFHFKLKAQPGGNANEVVYLFIFLALLSLVSSYFSQEIHLSNIEYRPQIWSKHKRPRSLQETPHIHSTHIHAESNFQQIVAGSNFHDLGFLNTHSLHWLPACLRSHICRKGWMFPYFRNIRCIKAPHFNTKKMVLIAACLYFCNPSIQMLLHAPSPLPKPCLSSHSNPIH